MASPMAGLEESDIFQFVEELFRSMLSYQGIHYTVVGVYRKNIDFVNWPAVLHSIGLVYKDISSRYHDHLSEVVSGLQKIGKCDVYMYSLGKSLFKRIDFSWSVFMVFVAHMISLATLAYKRGIIFLSDDIVASTAMYIKNYLQLQMLNLRGWRAFEQYCVSSIFKPREPGPKSGRSTAQATEAPNPYRILLVKQPLNCSYANHTFGKSCVACDVQIFKDSKAVNGSDQQVMFSLLDDDVAERESICSLCSNSSNNADKSGSFKVNNIIPRKRCILPIHVMMISAWVLNELQPEILCQIKITFS